MSDNKKDNIFDMEKDSLFPCYELENPTTEDYLKVIDANFEAISNRIGSTIEIREEACSIHGKTKHSYSPMSGMSICIKCVRERRFFKKEESDGREERKIDNTKD